MYIHRFRGAATYCSKNREFFYSSPGNQPEK